MAEFPAFPLWTDAYLGDTSHLDTLEHGTYLLLLIAMWRSGICRLPHNDTLLTRYAKLDPRQWRRIKPIIMPFFVVVDGDQITQLRLQDEWEFCKKRSKRQSNNSKARWLKNNGSYDAMAMPSQSHSDAPTPTPTPTPESKILNGNSGEKREARKQKPRHLTKSKNGRLWLDKGTEEFNQYAADYFVQRGHPVTLQWNGSGAWFNIGGEHETKQT